MSSRFTEKQISLSVVLSLRTVQDVPIEARSQYWRYRQEDGPGWHRYVNARVILTSAQPAHLMGIDNGYIQFTYVRVPRAHVSALRNRKVDHRADPCFLSDVDEAHSSLTRGHRDRSSACAIDLRRVAEWPNRDGGGLVKHSEEGDHLTSIHPCHRRRAYIITRHSFS
jgi:hypothetical protein